MKAKHLKAFEWKIRHTVSVVLSVALLLGCITFSTFAWLTAKDEPVVNEFTGSKLKIELTPDDNQGPYQLIPGMVYELEDSVAPIVTVEKGSVECYLFVVFHEVGTIVNGTSMHLDEFISYEYNSSENWGVLAGTAGTKGEWKIGTDENGMPYKDYIFYAKTPEDETDLCNYVCQNLTEDQSFSIMAKNGNGKAYFQVSDELTKQTVHPYSMQSNPYVTFTAYSIQTLGFKGETLVGTESEKATADMELAWAQVQAAIENNNTKSVVLK